jgi:hypothetical protein
MRLGQCPIIIIIIIIKLHFASHCAEATNVPWCKKNTTRQTWESFAASQSLYRVWLLHNMYRTSGEQLKMAAQRPPHTS